jgi:hypothetical protein
MICYSMNRDRRIVVLPSGIRSFSPFGWTRIRRAGHDLDGERVDPLVVE